MRSTCRSSTPSRSASASTARSARARCGRTSPSCRAPSTGYVSCYPNAGLPNAFGQYDEQPAETAGAAQGVRGERLRQHHRRLLRHDAGSHPRDRASGRRACRRATSGTPARQAPGTRLTHACPGLEPLVIRPDSNFQMIGERTNVTGSKKFERLVKANDWAGAATVALDQVRGGANIIDVNMDEGMLDSEACMTEFLNYIATEPEIARLPVMIDSSKWSVIEAGLKCVQGKAIVNSISLKEGEADFLHKARTVRRYGAAMIVMAFDEKGQADTVERKVEICQRAYKLLTEQAGVDPSDIIFDPNILAIATGLEEHNDYAKYFIEATRHHQGDVPGREDQRRRQQPVVLVPRQRRRPRSDPLGVPVPRHQGRPGHGHRQRRAADRLRGHPEGSARARRRHHLQPPARRHRADGDLRRAGQGRRHQARDRSEVARGLGRGAAVARARARRGRLHRGRRRRSARRSTGGRCWSSKAR